MTTTPLFQYLVIIFYNHSIKAKGLLCEEYKRRKKDDPPGGGG
jgi:hypothetical protein